MQQVELSAIAKVKAIYLNSDGQNIEKVDQVYVNNSGTIEKIHQTVQLLDLVRIQVILNNNFV